MTAAHYPVFLDLAGKGVLLVGGGAVALQKAVGLGDSGARVTVVAPEVHPDMQNVPGVVKIHRRKFIAKDLLGQGTKSPPWIVIAATDDEALNARVAAAARRARLWVNVVDRPALCGFIVPAVVRQGLVTFAVSTGGASPSLARFLAGRIGTAFGPEVAAVARLLGALRPRLKGVAMAPRKEIVERALERAAEAGFTAEALRQMEADVLNALKETTDGAS